MLKKVLELDSYPWHFTMGMAMGTSHPPGSLAILAPVPNQGRSWSLWSKPTWLQSIGSSPKGQERGRPRAGAAATCGRSPSCDPRLCHDRSWAPSSHWGPMAAGPALSTCPGGSDSSSGVQVSLTLTPVSSPLTQNLSVLQSRAYKIADDTKWMRELTELCVRTCVRSCQKQRKTETEKQRQRKEKGKES